MLALLAGLGVLVGISLVLFFALRPDRVTAKLAFPPDMEAAQIEALLGAVAGLPKHSRVQTSVEGQGGRLGFFLSASPRDLDTLRAALQGIAPGVRLESVDLEPIAAPTLRAHFGWRGSYLLLRQDNPELASAALLAVLRRTSRDERVRLTIEMRPLVRPKAPPIPRGTREPDLLTDLLTFEPPLPRDQVSAIRQQYAGPLLGVRFRIDIQANSKRRGQQLVNQIIAVVHSRSGARGRLSVRTHRFAVAGVGLMLAPPELTPLLAWPLGGPSVPGLRYNRSPQLLPDDVIPRGGKGRSFGVSTWPGLEKRRLVQPVTGSLSHTLLLGPTGSGKSTLLSHLFVDDLKAGHGALLLDMKGDTASDLLQRIPERRWKDVVVLDPADDGPVPGIKGLSAKDPDLVADLWVGIFRNLFHDSWGLRSERYIKLGVQTLAAKQGSNIMELPRVFHDLAFRRGLLSLSSDPYLASAWESFDSLSAQQQAEHLVAPLGKVQDVIGRERIRAVLGQADPKLDLTRAMARGQIVIVRLRSGVIGQPTAQLLGALIVYEAYQAVMSRQAVPEDRRRPFSIYVDEPAVLNALPVPLDSLFELARGLGVGLTLAAQSVSQLPDAVRRAALTNVATIACFRAGADDARLIARELIDVTADELQHLERFEAVLRLGIDHGLIAPTATVRTQPPTAPCSDPDQLQAVSAERYGGRPEPPSPRTPRQRPEPENPEAASGATPLGRVRRTR